MSDMEFLVARRGHVRGQITKLINTIGDASNLNKHMLLSNVSKLETLDKQITILNNDVGINIWEKYKSQEPLNKDLDECAVYSDNVSTCLTNMQIALEALAQPNGSNANNGISLDTPVTQRPNKLKLPDIPLPTYGHEKDETLTHFFQGFESIIDKHNLTVFEKFIYLKNQLRGEALALINSLSRSDQSYDAARELLEQAFASNIVQKYDVIRRMSKLKLSSDGSAYEFVSEMRVVCDLFKTLKIDIDTVLQYYIWHAMPSNLQTQLVNICNSNKPDLADIKTNIFPAIDRYNEINVKTKAKKSVGLSEMSGIESFAANVEYGKSNHRNNEKQHRVGFCSMCSTNDKRETSHVTRDCPTYGNPQAKLERLKYLGACTKCGFANHETSNCRFRFSKPCVHCDNPHMSFLCSKQNIDHKTKNVSKNGSNKDPKNINSSVVWTEFSLQNYDGSSSILPTFTFKIGDCTIRGMKDSGSQQSFISGFLAEKLNLSVERDNIPITVNGFNGSQAYNTKTVKVPFTITQNGGEVKAYCVPTIRTNLVLPGLSLVVQKFLNNGHKLADRFLSVHDDCISDINFILGTNDFNLLLEKQCSVGSQFPSVYSETSAGILLYGAVDRWAENFTSIPSGGACVVQACVAGVSNGASEVEKHPRMVEDDLTAERGACIESYSNVLSEENPEVDLDVKVNEVMKMCDTVLNYDQLLYNEDSVEVNNKVVNYVLDNAERSSDGRMVMPLPWRESAAPYLSSNFYLAKQILNSNLKRIKNDPVKIKMINDVFLEQEKNGIIERIENIDQYMSEHPEHSILPHMPIFKMDKATTKCRNVFLSNLCQKSTNDKRTANHNEALYAGPCLNQKITTALTHLRFGETLLTYDLKKAFLQIELQEQDTHKLLFLWYRNVEKEDFSLIAFRNLRLSFGLSASPMILMLTLYRMLIIDAKNDPDKLRDLKRLLYALFYVDNGAVTGSKKEVNYAYQQLSTIFASYKFNIQQVYTNHTELQASIDETFQEKTPEVVKVLGLNLHREKDVLFANAITLNPDANTKRLILKSIAGQYDTLNIQGPCLNRARVFLHDLQCDKTLGWDVVLSDPLQKEWRLIVKQANKTPPIEIKRNFGDRSDPYELIAFTDASKKIYAAVLYIKNLKTNEVTFMGAKNRLVNRQLESKTIPTLELQAITLGVEYLIDMKEELSGVKCMVPILISKLRLFTDSTISLNWISSYCHKHDKLANISIFSKNRLEYIEKMCQICAIQFDFVGTEFNPSDCMTRCLSHSQLLKSCYLSGPDFLSTPLDAAVREGLGVLVSSSSVVVSATVAGVSEVVGEATNNKLIEITNFSSLKTVVNGMKGVLKFVNKLKTRFNEKFATSRFKVVSNDYNFYEEAIKTLVRNDQMLYFSEIFRYYEGKNIPVKDIPTIISKFNVFVDGEGILRVKSKFDRWAANGNFAIPIFLSEKSWLTKLIVRDIHEKSSHGGCYNVLNVLRKEFWIPCVFSTVKKVLKDCSICKRFNARPIKLNQNSYRDFRATPPCEPFKFVFMDYLGPFTIKHGNVKQKVYLLICTCLWSRAIALQICPDLSVASFLRAFQMQIMEHGLPSRVFSDLGSQLTAGTNLITGYLSDVETISFFDENGIKPMKFQQYFKGNSALGSLVEVCVKFTKRLIFGSIRNNVLDYFDFEFTVKQTISLLNKRPVAFQRALRDTSSDEVPAPITPELLLRGRETISINVVPPLHPGDEGDRDWCQRENSKESLRQGFSQLRKVRERIFETYNEEYKQMLIEQATNENDRYKPVSHYRLEVGDVILLREQNMKINHYPLAIVTKVFANNIQEVTDVIARKGGTRELVKRHVSSVIPLLRPEESRDESVAQPSSEGQPSTSRRPKRKAALESNRKTFNLFSENDA